MYLNSPVIRYSDLNKHDHLQVFSVQYGLSDPMTAKEFEHKHLDENQKIKFRFKEWYDIMSEMAEEAWPDMEWLLVIRDEKIHIVIP